MVTQNQTLIDLDAMVKEALKERIDKSIGEVQLSTVMSLENFCKLNNVTRNFVMEHKDEFCVMKIGGKVLINMVAWREKLRSQK